MSNSKERLLKNYSVEIPKTDDAYHCKYILIKEVMPDKTGRWVIVCKNMKFHKDIADSLFKVGRKFSMFGGGKLRLNPFFDPPQLIAHNKSVEYGVAEPKIVGAILEDWANKNDVEFENLMVKSCLV